jgi:hypothetical protein
VVKPSFQVFSLSSKATNSVAAVVFLGSWCVAAVVIGFLLHDETVESVWKRSLRAIRWSKGSKSFRADRKVM